MSASHTPAPWLYVPEDDVDGDPRIDPLARHCVDHTVHIGPWVIHPQSEANARLIAAAPEMLEALSALVDRADKGPAKGSFREMIERARDVIAKATGGA